MFFLLLIVLGFVALLIWLANYETPRPAASTNGDKSLREEIEGIFQDLRDNAVTYNRAEVIPTLDKARDKVTDALTKRNLG